MSTLGRNAQQGFSVGFASSTLAGEPLGFQVRGRFGASDHEGVEGPYIGVQGWLYPYVIQQIVDTTADGHDHIYLRYAKADAGDDDWEMLVVREKVAGGFSAGNQMYSVNLKGRIIGRLPQVPETGPMSPRRGIDGVAIFCDCRGTRHERAGEMGEAR
ncbi:hypothetical protein [Lacipirellula limnantheis]|uniref:Uncharacterized protein n=1 Tax=Lacipirellula limnantheis TaxID=2528024 RepID=A0A517TUX7_9BACT|nr:hypothetical protein [Lacipirellula limnantheis]QDT72168.1 hypothetical protein I41_13350 [Lacipirellula limnantheis]